MFVSPLLRPIFNAVSEVEQQMHSLRCLRRNETSGIPERQRELKHEYLIEEWSATAGANATG